VAVQDGHDYKNVSRVMSVSTVHNWCGAYLCIGTPSTSSDLWQVVLGLTVLLIRQRRYAVADLRRPLGTVSSQGIYQRKKVRKVTCEMDRNENELPLSTHTHGNWA
jgi:hypothetical protein